MLYELIVTPKRAVQDQLLLAHMIRRYIYIYNLIVFSEPEWAAQYVFGWADLHYHGYKLSLPASQYLDKHSPPPTPLHLPPRFFQPRQK